MQLSRELVSWSKHCFLIDYLSFPLRNLLTSRLSPWEKKKQTNKQTPSPKFCIAFFQFLLGITIVARKIEDIAYAYTILFGGGKRYGDKQVVLWNMWKLYKGCAFPRVSILVWGRVWFSRELWECMNVFMVSTPNESEWIRNGFQIVFDGWHNFLEARCENG